jgi:putative drug exporter of the RND superfamily
MDVVARWCFRHRIIVVAVWVLALAGVFLGSRIAGSSYDNGFSLPGTDSTKALNLMQRQLPNQSGDTDSIVWHVKSGSVRDSAVQSRIAPMLAKVARVPEVGAVSSPYAPGNAHQVSKDGRTAYAQLTFSKDADAVKVSNVKKVIADAKAARSSGLQVELGGNAIENAQQTPQGISEVVGFVAAAIVLFIAFGSLLAMLLPLLTAAFAIGTGLLSVTLLSHAVSMPNFASLLGSLIGLGVAIDYALFIVSRHRSNLRQGSSPEDAAARALDTSGRAVLFAGGTVCIALLGMFVVNLQFLNGVAVAASLTVVLAVLAAETLLPAMFGFLGLHVLSRRVQRQLATGQPDPRGATSLTARWSAFVERNPRRLAAVAVAIMAVLAIPLLSLRLAISDQGNDPTSTTTRHAYDLLAKGFGPGFNGPLLVVAETTKTADATPLWSSIQHTPGVAQIAPMPSKPGDTVRVAQVIPTTSPQDKRTDHLISRLRDNVIPKAEHGGIQRAYVGGVTAVNKDFSTITRDKLPEFIGAIIGLGFILLLLAFRSLVVPLTSAIMNLLAAAASFGILVAFFQWGWITRLIGRGDSVPVNAFLPIIMLALLFGLSMDYQVFLVSRMHEEWVNTEDNGHSVRIGQAATGRVITAAATIMILVFGSFLLAGQRVIAEFGIGLASAVLLDAFILRTVLVPAVMHLLAERNWWLPRGLDRALPRVAVEGAES